MFSLTKLRRYVALPIAGAAAVSLAACGGSGGGDTLTFADLLPDNHYISEGLAKPFLAELEKISTDAGCPVTVEYFPGGQLGDAADQVANLNTGVFDMAHVAPAYNEVEMPLGNAFNLPRMADDAATLGKAYLKTLQNPESTIYKYDYARNNIKPLTAYALPLYQLATTKPINGTNALAGLNIRSGGGAQDFATKALKGNPVRLSTAEQYSALERGIVDGGIFNLPSMISNRTMEVTKYFTTNANVAGFNGSYAISQAAWDRLSSCAQESLQKAAQTASIAFADSLTKQEADAVTRLKKEGLTAVTFTAEQQAALDQQLKDVPDQWVNDLPSGAPGQEAVSEARSAIAEIS